MCYEKLKIRICSVMGIKKSGGAGIKSAHCANKNVFQEYKGNHAMVKHGFEV